MRFFVLLFLTVATALAAEPAGGAVAGDYLVPVVKELERAWPKNHEITLVFHGHSVPAGYFQTPVVDTFNAYPMGLHRGLKERFPLAVINVIVTAIGGEDSVHGAARFERDVLSHRPDVVFVDYALNDRRLGLAPARAAWVAMITQAQTAGAKVILLTPTADQKAKLDDPVDPLNQHAAQIRELAREYHTGLVDSLARFTEEMGRGTPLKDLMSQVNHPNARGHQLVTTALLEWFPASPASNSPAATAPVSSSPKKSP